MTVGGVLSEVLKRFRPLAGIRGIRSSGGTVYCDADYESFRPLAGIRGIRSR